MTILDRYVLRLYFKVFFICFVSLTGLYIVVDAFSNLDEHLTYGEKHGGLVRALWLFYSPRVFPFFDRVAGILGLASALFAIAWMDRNHETMAILAGGVPKGRIVRSLVAAAVLLSVLAAANREFVIPRFRESLSRNAQSLVTEKGQPIYPRYDEITGILLGGRNAVSAKQTIIEPSFGLPLALNAFGRHLTSREAVYLPRQATRPSGYLLRDVIQPANLQELPSGVLHGKTVIYSPRDADWLAPGECFVASDVEYRDLTANASWRQLSSTAELVSDLRNPSLDFGADLRVLIHARALQPLLDVVLFFVGVPLVLTRQNRNMFVVAGMGLGVVGALQLTTMLFHSLGANYVISPALAAWSPLVLFAPLAFAFAPRWQE